MRQVLIVALALVLIAVIHSCKTEDPFTVGSCVASFDCDAGFECIDKECVKIEGGGDTDTKDDSDAPDMGQDTATPDDVISDETPDEGADGLFPGDDDEIDVDVDGLPDSQTEEEADVAADGADVPTEGESMPVDDAAVPDVDLDTDTDVDSSNLCSGVTCGGHGSCKVVGGVADCTCYSGYQDNDGDNVCLPMCAYSGLDCASNHAYCDDTTGTPHCVCNSGYQDNDLNNTCTANCTTANLTCTGGTCSDANGTAHCTCTDTNYQDNDNNGTCLPTCATAGLTCSNGSCEDSSGTATCVCNTGYANPPNCTDCATDFHKDGVNCVPNVTCPVNYCNGHGTCSDATGSPVCSCNAGYALPQCATCADGYQDSDTNGTCLEDCDDSCGQAGGLFATESHGSCQYSGGNASCVCEAGWENPILIWPPMSPECSSCDTSNPPAAYPYGCPADCADASPVLTCNNGDCFYDTSSGDIYCHCNSGTYNPATTNCE